MAATRSLNASASSGPSQLISISSPHFTHAPSTLNTLFAFAFNNNLLANHTHNTSLLKYIQYIIFFFFSQV